MPDLTSVGRTNGRTSSGRARRFKRTDRWWQRTIERSAEQLCAQASRLLAVLLLGLAVLYSVHRTGQLPTTAVVEAIARAAVGVEVGKGAAVVRP